MIDGSVQTELESPARNKNGIFRKKKEDGNLVKSHYTDSEHTQWLYSFEKR